MAPLEEGRYQMHRAHRTLGRSIATVKGLNGGFKRQTGLLLLGWHRFGALTDGLSIEWLEFKAQLDLLESLNANVLPLSEAVAGLVAGRLPRRAVALTFDDGYLSVAEQVWPLLRHKELPATAFIVPEFLGEGTYFPWDKANSETMLMTVGDVQRLAAEGMDVQSHSLRHRWLPAGDETTLLADLTDAKRSLQQMLDAKIEGLAYPAGGWDQRVRRIARAAGYRYAVTVDRGVNDIRRPCIHNLKRSIAPQTANELDIMLSGGFDYLRGFDRLRRRKAASSLKTIPW